MDMIGELDHSLTQEEVAQRTGTKVPAVARQEADGEIRNTLHPLKHCGNMPKLLGAQRAGVGLLAHTSSKHKFTR